MEKIVILLVALIGLSLGLDPTKYAASKWLSPSYQIHWKVADGKFYLGLQVNTTGWVGFGIGEPTSGSMPGSDIVTATVIDGKMTISDRYALEKSRPSEDQKQDWTLISGSQENGLTTVELSRKMVSDDRDQDRDIVTGENRIIFAYGTTNDFQYHSSNRGATVLTLVGEEPVLPTELPYWELKSTNFSSPPMVTTYAYTSLRLPFADGPFHMIAFEPIIEEVNAQYVHHFVLYFCSSPNPMFLHFENRTDYKGVQHDRGCTGQIWGWAPGMASYVMPDIAGFRVGSDDDDYKYLLLQTHYDNPAKFQGIFDNSGVRIYYTKNLRQHDAAVLALGDPYVNNQKLIPPGVSDFHVEYECIPDATLKMPYDIQIFTSFFHMHQSGKQMWTTQWRDGKKIQETNRVDFWDFGFQQGTPVNFTIRRGDRFNTHCVYDTRGRSESTRFGPASQDEMCIDFLNYYPRLPGSPHACGYSWNRQNNVSVSIWGMAPVGNSTGLGFTPNPVDFDPPGGMEIKFGAIQADSTSPIEQAASKPSSTMLAIIGVVLVLLLLGIGTGMALVIAARNPTLRQRIPFLQRFRPHYDAQILTEDEEGNFL